MTLSGQNRLRSLPAIRRARGFYLYDNGGRRFLDLYQDGGRAWLGHRPDGLSLQLKNTLSRGVYAPYPGSEEGKLLKAGAALAVQAGANSPVIRYYTGTPVSEALPAAADPLFEGLGRCSLWRPGLPWPVEAELVEILVPLPGFDSGRLIAGKEDNLPPGDMPSPVIAAALTRCLWTLSRVLKERTVPEELNTGGLFRQTGPYLVYQGGEEAYGALFDRALEAGILIPPEPGYPLILPCEYSPGDQSLVSGFFRTLGELS